jgi:NADH-quinone oxidoreductase subunit A
MTFLVGYCLLFLAIAIFFIFFHLGIIGKFVRPEKPDADKLTIYECGEPTIGSAWIQFDLRFYVVALLFVIFDVEVAFFFPWAVVFGKANNLSAVEKVEGEAQVEQYRQQAQQFVPPPHIEDSQRSEGNRDSLNRFQEPEKYAAENSEAARQFAWLAFWDILVFFGVLLVGFAYLWRRGDLDWVRSTLAERLAAPTGTGPPAEERALVGAGRD